MKSIVACNNVLELPKDASILHLSPFPPDGEWGGAIRSQQVFKVIKDIYPNSKILHIHQLPIKMLPDIPEWAKQDHQQLDDIFMMFKDYGTENHLEHIPDAIAFDHPWLWEEAKKLKKLFPNAKLIHLSHNIEFLVKSELLEGLYQDAKISAIKYVRELEEEIARECDLVLCVTELDKLWFQNNGAQNVIAANNGTVTTPQKVISPNRYALVIGSGHPPNVEGSIKYLYDATEWMPENSRLIYVGSVCGAIRGNIGKEINPVRNTEVILLGVRSNEDLSKLIASASVILLPIPYGGGSNLKTAEAIASGRPVVGTTKSFRAFDNFASSRNTVIADEVDDFKEACFNFVEEKLPTVYRYGHENLLWKATLSPFRKYLAGE
jgi:glycosyltransferase involved in cell wall biosynthesis